MQSRLNTPISPCGRRVFPKVRVEGPPGSGKSTVANIIHDEMVRVSRASAAEPKPVPAAEPPRVIRTTTVAASQLIGRHIGEAQQLVQSVVESAEWGLLIIENTHDLMAQDDVFRRESLTVLTSEIRRIEHSLAVCAMGYPVPMKSAAAKEFAGLFPVTVKLGSITPSDARELAVRFASGTIEPRALDAIEKHIEDLEKRSENEHHPLIDRLGNARFIRRVVERASSNNLARMSLRDLSTVTDEELTTLTVEDVAAALKACTRV